MNFKVSGPLFDGLSIHIVEDINLVDTVEDWSQVRSPGRARRRRRMGHRQRIRLVRIPKKDAFVVNGTYCMHPETAAAFRRMIEEKMNVPAA